MKAFGGIQHLQFISMKEFGGLNTQNPFQDSQNNLLSCGGLSLEHYPVIRTRRTFSSIYSNLFSTLASPVSMTSYNGTIYAACEGYFKKSDGTSYAGALSNSNEVSFTKFKGNLGSTYLIFSNGTDLKKFNGTTVSNLLAGGYPVTVNGFFITSHKNRLFCTSNKTTTLLFSALNKADDWATANDAGSIEIDELSDQNITAIFSAGDRLLIFRENSFFELIGTSPSNFRIVQISKEIGAINNRSVTMLNGIVYFSHYTGTYAYSSGSSPIRISTKIDNSRKFEYYFNSYNLASIKQFSFLGNDGSYLYSSSYDGDYMQTFQYSPQSNEWLGFCDSNIQSITLNNNETFILNGKKVGSFFNYSLNKIDNRSESSISATDYCYWFFTTPLINSGTTLGNVMVRNVLLRCSYTGSFKVYLLGRNKGDSQFGFPYGLQGTFPFNPSFAGVNFKGSLIYTSPNATSNENFPYDKGIKIPIPSMIDYNTASILIFGTNQFTLNEIALEVIPTPFNANTNI